MREIARIDIPLASQGSPIQSLAWEGDCLVDWAGGGDRYGLDGSFQDARRHWGFPFDHCVVSPNLEYAVVVQQGGTKGVLLRNGEIVREINRSLYFANAYLYPITLFETRSGQTILAHCPEQYNRLEFENVETGERLSHRESQSPDFFHSRLEVSPDGHYLISAGWVWHPWLCLGWFDLSACLNTPSLLDETNGTHAWDVEGWEDSTATFLDSSRVVLHCEKEIGPNRSRFQVNVYNLETRQYESLVEVKEPLGEMMAVGGEFVIGFYQHPTLIDLKTGRVVHRWNEIDSGSRTDCFFPADHQMPPIATDPKNQRFAVASEERITVIQLGE